MSRVLYLVEDIDGGVEFAHLFRLPEEDVLNPLVVMGWENMDFVVGSNAY